MIREYVLGFAFRHDKSGTLVLIRKARPTWQAGKLNGVGGKIEINEAPIGAMTREFFEETGARIPISDWLKFGTMSGKTFQRSGGRQGDEWLVHLFASNTWEVDEAHTTTDEEIVRVHKDHLPGGLMHNLPWLIPMAYECLHNMKEQFFIEEVGPWSL